MSQFCLGLGSPPRVREKPVEIVRIKDVIRITPASAGKTDVSVSLINSSGDHPRECGKNLSYYSVGSYQIGSPPRVREKLWYGGKQWIRYRITPASAGKTLMERRLIDLTPGSPPRVREKLHDLCKIDRYVRITPASAGKTVQKVREWHPN